MLKLYFLEEEINGFIINNGKIHQFNILLQKKYLKVFANKYQIKIKEFQLAVLQLVLQF